MNAFAILSLLALITLFSLGIFVFSKDHKSLLNRLFFCYCLAGSFNSFRSYSLFQAESFESAQFWIGSNYSWPFILVFQLHFILVFTEKTKLLKNKLAMALIYLPALSFSFIALTTDYLSRTPIKEPWGWSASSPPSSLASGAASIWIIVMALMPIALCFVYLFRSTERTKRKQAIFVTIGVSMNMAWSVIVRGVLPDLGIRVPPLSSTGALFASIFYGYAILRYGLFTLTPTAAAEGIVSTMSDALFLANPERRVQVVNQAASELLGYEEGSLINQPVEMLFENSGKDGLTEAWLYQRLLEQGRVSDQEMYFKGRDGSIIPVSLSASVMRDKQGRLLGIIYAGRDITKRKEAETALQEANEQLEARVAERTTELIASNRKLRLEIDERNRAEAALRESETQYRGIFDSALEGILILDLDGAIVDANPQTCSMYGYSPEEIVRLRVDDLVRADQHYYVKNFLERVKESDVYRTDGTNIRKDGTPFTIEVSGTNFDYKGKKHLLLNLRDLTEEKKLKAQLQQAQKMESIGTLAGGIAHDFNNILSSIIGYGELARDDVPSDSEARDDIEQVLQAGYRARDLVKQILTFSRQTVNDLAPVHLHSVVEESLKLMRSSLPVTVDIRQNIAHCDSVLGDATQMHQVVMNLCTNAYHAMDSDGGTIEVRLEPVELQAKDNETVMCTKEETGGDGLCFQADLQTTKEHLDLPPGPYCRLVVSDDGQGMSREVKGRIFDPYFTTKETDKGTGLGLSVVHGIVTNHGGGICVYSQPGVGTAFHIFIPMIKERAKNAEIISHGMLPTGRERILFVDDEPPIVKMAKEMLERLGYTVAIRTSSLEALELFKANPTQFDLVITDMTMPHMTGDKLTKEILAIHPDIPIILCTGFSQQINEQDAKAIGVAEFILKPIIKKDLATILRKVLDR